MLVYILTDEKIATKMLYYLLLFKVGIRNLLLFTTTLLLVARNTLICDKIYNWFIFDNFIFLRIDNCSCKCLIIWDHYFYNFSFIVSTIV